MEEQEIQRGAEAIIFLTQDGKVIKKRVAKGYRLKELDTKIRKQRTKRETKLMTKAHTLIPAPSIIDSDEKTMEITMEYITGKKLSEHLDTITHWKDICTNIGKTIAQLHDADIIHGDLTTSNMIYSEQNKKVYFIDFGLGFTSSRIEDKAVDLHLIKQALEAKHYKHFQKFFQAILTGYQKSKNYEKTITQFAKVEQRGRYKGQY